MGALVLGALASACSGGGEDGGTGPTPSFSMSVSPSTLSLDVPTFLAVESDDSAAVAGDLIAAAVSGNLTVSITRSGGFEGAVTVTVENLPAGVTVAPTTIASGATSTTLTLTAGATAAAGNATITIRGTGTGVTARTATVALTVVAPPGMSIALSANAISVVQGGTGNTTVNITRTGSFTGAVNLTATGAPAGLTIGFNPQSATGASSQLTVTVGGSVATGAHQISIQGSGTGVPNSTVTLTVTVTAPTPAISLGLNPSTVSIQQGQSGNSALTITRTSFTGAVTLTSSGAPNGMAVSFNPTSTTGTTSTVTVDVGAGVAAGNHQVTISGSGTGVAQASVVLTVTVTAAPGSIVLSLAPNALSIQQGQNSNTALTITRTNFAGTVNLTSTGAPANVAVAFNPAGTTANASTVTVTVGAAVAPGNYPITIRGNGAGINEATVVLTLTVTASGGGGNVTFTFCAQTGIPLWFAFQNFGGPWTAVAGNAGVYNFTVNPRGVVAWVMQDGAKTNLEVFYGSSIDLQTRGQNLCTGTGGTKTINGTAANIPLMDIATINMGTGGTTLFAPGPFQLTNVQDGLRDLIGVRQTIAALPVTNSIVFQHDLNIANNGSVGTIDFDAGLPPDNRTATIANIGADQAMFSASILSKNRSVGAIHSELPGTTTSRPWKAAKDALMLAGDWHLQSVVATPTGNMTGFPYRSVTQFNRFAADRTYTLPAFLSTPPTISNNGTAPYVRLNVTWAIQGADYNDFWSITFSPASGSVSRVTVSGVEGYFGSGPVALHIPTFDGSFNPAWGLQPGIQLDWIFMAAGGPAWGSAVFNPTAFEGAVGYSAAMAGTYTP